MIKLYPTAIGVGLDVLHAPCLACENSAEHGFFVFYPLQQVSTSLPLGMVLGMPLAFRS